jgi:hypothetical protein
MKIGTGAKWLIWMSFFVPVKVKAVLKGARLEQSKVLAGEITLGQCPVPFWYRQSRVDGNIARTGRGLYSFLTSKLLS